MNREVTPKQTWLIRACLVTPMMTISTYHIVRYERIAGIDWLLLLLIPALILWVTIIIVERKYTYIIPAPSDLIIGVVSAGLIATTNALATNSIHPGNAAEMVDSVLGVFAILPFILLLKSKKESIATEQSRLPKPGYTGPENKRP